jgi:asparagine synthetase A
MSQLTPDSVRSALASSAVICFRHPRYDGKERPVLSCKTCCAIFISTIKARVSEGQSVEFDPRAWLDDKRREAEEASRRAAVKGPDSPEGTDPGV